MACPTTRELVLLAADAIAADREVPATIDRRRLVGEVAAALVAGAPEFDPGRGTRHVFLRVLARRAIRRASARQRRADFDAGVFSKRPRPPGPFAGEVPVERVAHSMLTGPPR